MFAPHDNTGRVLFAMLFIGFAAFSVFLFFHNLPNWCETPETSGVSVEFCRAILGV